MTATKPSRISSPVKFSLTPSEIGVSCVLINRPGERRLKPHEVGSSLMSVDIVGEGEDDFAVAVIVLKGKFDIETVLLSLNIRSAWDAGHSYSYSGIR